MYQHIDFHSNNKNGKQTIITLLGPHFYLSLLLIG